MMSANSGNNTPKLIVPHLIVIVGFMGAGKTTVARELARLLNCQAIDLDELITERQRRTPAEVIEQSGEAEFRRIETETLRQLLNERAGDSEKCVIALGGGAWTLQTNRDLIKAHEGFSIWLNAPLDLCWQRIEAGRELRPLAPSRETAEELHGQRRPVYELAKMHIVISENMNATETAKMIAETVLR